MLRIVGLAMSPEFVLAVPNGASAPSPERFAVLWMRRPAVEAAYDMRASFNSVVLDLTPGASPEQVIPRLDELLDRYGGLGAVARESNVAGAFAIHPRHKARIKDRRVLLVDDVYTTGATVSAAATALRNLSEGDHRPRPVWSARNASMSAARLMPPVVCPASASCLSSTGRVLAVEYCSAAHSFLACSGSTRVSFPNAVSSTAGYFTPSATRWYGE